MVRAGSFPAEEVYWNLRIQRLRECAAHLLIPFCHLFLSGVQMSRFQLSFWIDLGAEASKSYTASHQPADTIKLLKGLFRVLLGTWPLPHDASVVLGAGSGVMAVRGSGKRKQCCSQKLPLFQTTVLQSEHHFVRICHHNLLRVGVCF